MEKRKGRRKKDSKAPKDVKDQKDASDLNDKKLPTDYFFSHNSQLSCPPITDHFFSLNSQLTTHNSQPTTLNTSGAGTGIQSQKGEIEALVRRPPRRRR